jgi:hypothetical protein
LIAAPGTPKAEEMPSFSRTRTAASTARIRAMTVLLCLDNGSMAGPVLFFNFSRKIFHLSK